MKTTGIRALQPHLGSGRTVLCHVALDLASPSDVPYENS